MQDGPDEMQVVIPNIPVSANRHYDCVYVVLDSMLRFYGYEPTSVCFPAWEFAYRWTQSFGFWGRLTPLSTTLERQGIIWMEGATSDAAEGWNRIRRLTRATVPVAVSVDVFPLAAAGLFPRLHHASHEMIVAGFDDQAGTIRLVDPSPWQPAERDIPYKLFRACWNTSDIARADADVNSRYHWSWLEVPENHRRVSRAEVVAILQDNLAAMAERPGDSGVAFGLAGVKALTRDVPTWATLAEDLLTDRLGLCVELLQDVAIQREGHAGFLRNAGSSHDIARAALVADDFERLSQRWFVVRNLCVKGTSISRGGRAILPRIRAKLSEVVALEAHCLEQVGALVGP